MASPNSLGPPIPHPKTPRNMIKDKSKQNAKEKPLTNAGRLGSPKEYLRHLMNKADDKKITAVMTSMAEIMKSQVSTTPLPLVTTSTKASLMENTNNEKTSEVKYLESGFTQGILDSETIAMKMSTSEAGNVVTTKIPAKIETTASTSLMVLQTTKSSKQNPTLLKVPIFLTHSTMITPSLLKSIPSISQSALSTTTPEVTSSSTPITSVSRQVPFQPYIVEPPDEDDPAADNKIENGFTVPMSQATEEASKDDLKEQIDV